MSNYHSCGNRLARPEISSSSSNHIVVFIYFDKIIFNALCSVQTDRCRFYAKKCINEAKPILNYAFCILAGLILAKLEIGQRNKTDAKAALQDARRFALLLSDKLVMDYVKKGKEV